MKNVSGNFLDDDELDGVVGGYDSVVALIPDSSGQGMQPMYLSSRDNMSDVVVQTGSSDPLQGAYGIQSDMGQDSVSLSDLVTEREYYPKLS